MKKVLIIGSGPAGYTAAIYTGRAGLDTTIYTGSLVGGQITKTDLIENFPNYSGSGLELMENLKRQAINFGARIVEDSVTSIDSSSRPFLINSSFYVDSIIIATGSTPRKLGIEGLYNVSFCALCDGFFYKKKDVAVIGGGDTACSDALYLSKICKKVYLIHRRDTLRASKILQDRVFATENIEVLFNSRVTNIYGKDNIIEEIEINKTNKLSVQGLFEAIGTMPNTEIFKGVVDIDEFGYIVTEPGSTVTSIPGIYAAGECMDRKYRQVIVSSGYGAMAGIEVSNE